MLTIFNLILLDLKRVAGNKKGIFTRERQPKWAAHILRDRYQSMSSNPEEGSKKWDSDNSEDDNIVLITA